MTGHIRRRGERSWELKFEAGTDPATGKRLTQYHSFKGTKREAQRKLTELIEQVNKGAFIKQSRETVAEFMARWQRDWAAINVGPKTGERYGELLRVHIRPHIGSVALQELRPARLAELYAQLLREGRRDGKGLRRAPSSRCMP